MRPGIGYDVLSMGVQQDTCTPFEDEDDDEEERQHAPPLRKSLQSNILKLLHEIERLQAKAAA